MPISLPRTGSASSASIAALSKAYGKLPTAFVVFLAAHDGVEPPDNVLEGLGDGIGVRAFIPASEILSTANATDGLSAKFIPFAEDACGNYVCIGVGDHRVYFWDHEVEGETVVSETFSEFLERLRPFDISAVESGAGQVVSAWIDPDFKARLLKRDVD